MRSVLMGWHPRADAEWQWRAPIGRLHCPLRQSLPTVPWDSQPDPRSAVGRHDGCATHATRSTRAAHAALERADGLAPRGGWPGAPRGAPRCTYPPTPAHTQVSIPTTSGSSAAAITGAQHPSAGSPYAPAVALPAAVGLPRHRNLGASSPHSAQPFTPCTRRDRSYREDLARRSFKVLDDG